ncbi:hypothetical protein, partial [Tolypothrix sp. FACHB-123]|uniref:hypothetical protein n=1 Tax=Tolypothrix sp. FACHB-123 TaxID=2692868 RepID=UPI001A7E5BE6
ATQRCANATTPHTLHPTPKSLMNIGFADILVPFGLAHCFLQYPKNPRTAYLLVRGLLENQGRCH